MATSGTILSGQLHETSEEGRANGTELGGKAALIPFHQSETVFNDHVLSLPLFAFPHSNFLSLPHFSLLLLFMWSKFLKPSLTLGFLRTTLLKASLWMYYPY